MRKMWLILTVAVQTAMGQVPKVGLDAKTELACWNIEWFGDTQFGPTDETLQYNNVKNAIQSADLDILALEEVSNTTTFASLMADLPQYGYALASYSQTQKTALLWKKSLFRRYQSGLILNAYSSVFANGRLPLEVTLVSDSLNHFDTLYCIVLHMKANTGTNSEKLQAYYDRRDAGTALKNYLDQTRAGQKVAVMGDWNDRLTTSIWKDSISPYKNFLNDPTHYFFTTLQRNQNGETTLTTFTNSFIDHILISDRLKQHYQAGSATVFRLDNYITSYGTTTTDHFPVYTYFYFGTGTGMNEKDLSAQVKIYPNPSSSSCIVETGNLVVKSMKAVSMLGEQIPIPFVCGLPIEVSKQQTGAGVFQLVIETEKGVLVKKVVLE
jgi:endonuclease/exonuclease/phosphatase family metal-dependent hydrolase